MMNLWKPGGKVEEEMKGTGKQEKRTIVKAIRRTIENLQGSVSSPAGDVIKYGRPISARNGAPVVRVSWWGNSAVLYSASAGTTGRGGGKGKRIQNAGQPCPTFVLIEFLYFSRGVHPDVGIGQAKADFVAKPVVNSPVLPCIHSLPGCGIRERGVLELYAVDCGVPNFLVRSAEQVAFKTGAVVLLLFRRNDTDHYAGAVKIRSRILLSGIIPAKPQRTVCQGEIASLPKLFGIGRNREVDGKFHGERMFRIRVDGKSVCSVRRSI